MFETCGSPLAIWRLRFDDDYEAIRFPADGFEECYPNLKPKRRSLKDFQEMIALTEV